MIERSGPDHLDNYAWACPFCNQRKGRRVRGRHGHQLSRLFDPRRDVWPEHFALAMRGLFIVGLDAVGLVTARVLGFNDSALDGPLAARARALFEDRFPPVWARPWLIDPAV